MLTAPAHTVAQAAELLGVDDGTVRGWIASKQLAAFNVSASGSSKRPTWRILDADLRAFIARRSTRHATVAAEIPKRRMKAAGVIEFFK